MLHFDLVLFSSLWGVGCSASKFSYTPSSEWTISNYSELLIKAIFIVENCYIKGHINCMMSISYIKHPLWNRLQQIAFYRTQATWDLNPVQVDFFFFKSGNSFQLRLSIVNLQQGLVPVLLTMKIINQNKSTHFFLVLASVGPVWCGRDAEHIFIFTQLICDQLMWHANITSHGGWWFANADQVNSMSKSGIE